MLKIMKTPIYLDYNATTPIAPEVAEEMLPYIQTHFGNPSSSYAIGRHNKEAIEKARMQVANLIGASLKKSFLPAAAPNRTTTPSGGSFCQSAKRQTYYHFAG
jgi:cysteine desulfurase